ALLKIFRYACPLLSAAKNPSGYTSLSMLVYGSLAVIASTSVQGWHRIPVLALGAALIGAIAASRIALGAHSPADTAAGMMVGLAALSPFAYRCIQRRSELAALRPLVLASALVVVLLHGQQL